jgi:FkbM family methyltransferase
MNFTLKKIAYSIWHSRAKLFLDFPIPCILPFGSIYLAYGDGMGFMLFLKRPYEEKELKYVSEFLKPGMVFVDVGANQGIYTLLAAKRVGQEGKVFSFEPVPSQIAKLKRNIKINGFKNVVTEQLALGANPGKGKMHICIDGDEALSSLREPAEDATSPKEIVEVKIDTLDDYVKKSKNSSINFIKIDVEGGELEVLKGASDVLKNMRPVILCEVQDKRTEQWGYKASEICNLLKGYNYSLFDFSEDGNLKPHEILNRYEVGVNLVAMPKEKTNE